MFIVCASAFSLGFAARPAATSGMSNVSTRPIIGNGREPLANPTTDKRQFFGLNQ